MIYRHCSGQSSTKPLPIERPLDQVKPVCCFELLHREAERSSFIWHL